MQKRKNAIQKRGTSVWKKVWISAGICVFMIVVICGWISYMPGAVRYRNVAEVTEDESGSVVIGDITYEFAGPVEDGVKRGSLLGYAKDGDGYVTEFYSAGEHKGIVIAWRRTLMGDMWMLRAR